MSCVCYSGGIVMIDVIWRRLCVSMIICYELSNCATSEAVKYHFRAANFGGGVRSILLLLDA